MNKIVNILIVSCWLLVSSFWFTPYCHSVYSQQPTGQTVKQFQTIRGIKRMDIIVAQVVRNRVNYWRENVNN